MKSRSQLRPGVMMRARAATGNEELSASKHLRRLATLLALAVPIFFLFRSVMVPESFGRDGHYRATAVDEIISQESAYLTSFTCSECHEETMAEAAEGAHSAIQCETCHGPAQGHLTLNDKVRVKLESPKAPAACLRCHDKVAGRPEAFPQIAVEQHAAKNGFEAGEACDECHESHDP